MIPRQSINSGRGRLPSQSLSRITKFEDTPPTNAVRAMYMCTAHTELHTHMIHTPVPLNPSNECIKYDKNTRFTLHLLDQALFMEIFNKTFTYIHIRAETVVLTSGAVQPAPVPR